MAPPGVTTEVRIDDAPQRPRELSELELSITEGQGSDEPTLAPPEIEGGQSIAGITAWQADKRVGALWGINQVRNSWVFVTGVGWRKLVNNSDSAIVALTMLSAHAKQLNSRVDYREEADGMVYEIYAW